MEDWIKELNKFKTDNKSQVTMDTYNSNSRKLKNRTSSVSRFPSFLASSRPQSVAPANFGKANDDFSSTDKKKARYSVFLPGMKKKEEKTQEIPQNIPQKLESTTQIDENVYSSQYNELSKQKEQEQQQQNEGNLEDSKELQTVTKRLTKAKNLSSKYEKEIKILNEKVDTLIHENKELTMKLSLKDNSKDIEKEREELENFKEQLAEEKKLKAELIQEMKDAENEIQELKKSINSIRTTSAIHSKPSNFIVSNPVIYTDDNNISPTQNVKGIRQNVNNYQPTTCTGPLLDVSTPADFNSWLSDEEVFLCMGCKTEFWMLIRKV